MTEIDLTPITRLEYDIDAILNDHAVAEPITRIELILSDIVAGNTTTVEPVTRIETYLAIISGANYPVPEPVTRIETFLAIIAGEDYETPEAVTRLEGLLAEWVEKGSGIWKTVTGTLIHLTDALASPMQKCEVSLEPIQAGSGDPSPDNIRPITGWTGCEVTRTGENLFANDTSKLEEITYLSSGTPTTRWGYVIDLPAGTYRISAWVKQGESQSMYFYGGRFKKGTSPYERVTTQNLIAGAVITPQTITLADDEVIIYYNGTGNTTKEQVAGTLSKFNIQIEAGSTTTNFEEYQGTTLSVTFPDTVYGGEYEFVSGDRENKLAKIVLDENSEISRVGTKTFRITPGDAKVIPSAYDTTVYTMCDTLKSVAPLNLSNEFEIALRTLGQIWFILGVDTVNEAKQFFGNNPTTIIYPLETPTELSLTPQEISTLKGVNNVWSNSNGDTTIIYKAQAS